MKKYVLYDGRARSGDTDDATVIEVASSEHECKQSSRIYKGYDYIWYEYDVQGRKLINGKIRSDLSPIPEK